MKKLLSTLLIFVLATGCLLLLSGCTNPFKKPCEHADGNFDGVCDLCQTVVGEAHVLCVDADANEKCDVCAKDMPLPEPEPCAHSYANSCDTDCDDCGEVRKTEHNYKTDCDVNCDVCGFVRELDAHLFDDRFDAVCNGCGYVRDDCDYTDGKLVYVLSEDKKSYVVSSVNENKSAPFGTLTIPATVNGKPVSSIDDYVFAFCEDLTAAVISDGVSKIGEGAFLGCPNLSSVTIGNRVSVIGKSAFYDCSALSTVKYNTNLVASLGADNSVFFNAGKKSEGIKLVIGEGVTSIPSYLFSPSTDSEFAPNLVSVEFPKTSGAITVSESAFEYCDRIENVYIYNLAAWCNSSFYNVYSNPIAYGAKLLLNGAPITELEIPAGVTSLPYSAFYAQDSIVKVTVPASLKSVKNNAFGECVNIGEVYVSSVESWCKIDFVDEFSNPVYYRAKLFVNGNVITDLVIAPDSGVTKIPARAFYAQDTITSVSLPEGVEVIGAEAFADCIELLTVDMKDEVKLIGDGAFAGCRNITSIATSNGIESIGNRAFAGCVNLLTVTVPAGVKYMGEAVFTDCPKLVVCCEAIEQPSDNYWNENWVEETITVYWKCSGITVYGYKWLRCVDYLKSYDFTVMITGYVGNGTVLEIPSSVNEFPVIYVDAYAFSGLTEVTEVIIPDSVTAVGEGAFAGCTSLESITLPFAGISRYSEGFVSHFGYIFGYDIIETFIEDFQYEAGGKYYVYNIPESLKNVKITSEVIGDFAFRNCSDIVSVKFAYGLTSIGEEAFYGCTSMTELVLPDSVMDLGRSAFEYCISLVEVKLSTNLINIGEEAFADCENLVTVYMTDKVNTVGAYAFFGCLSLETINYSGSEEAWQQMVVDIENAPLENAIVNYNFTETEVQ